MERETLQRLLGLRIEQGASGIHFQPGTLPRYRVHGDLVEPRYELLTPGDTDSITHRLCESNARSC
jgi:Tfp pilus assembly pilus retraction ATPase PilT